jgi:hypothetical protein
MSIEITLNLPESLIENAKRFGGATNQGVEDALAEALELMFPMWEDSPDGMIQPLISTLSDKEVLQLANSTMDNKQDKRLGELQTKGKAAGLSAAQRYELLTLLRIYQIGLLRKSEALAEAVQRELRSLN